MKIITRKDFLIGDVIIIQPMNKELLDKCLKKMKINLSIQYDINDECDCIAICPYMKSYFYDSISRIKTSLPDLDFYLINLNQMAKVLGVK